MRFKMPKGSTDRRAGIKDLMSRMLLGSTAGSLPDGVGPGSLYKKMIAVAWPAALEGMLVSLMNTLDTMMVGTISPTAIAAVGLCAQPRMILLLIVQAVCIGTTAIVARRKGEERQDSAVSCMKQSLAIVTVIGVIITTLALLFAEPFLMVAGAEPGDTLPDAALYFRIISAAFIANCWSLCICAAQRGIGKTRITMVTNMIANIVNVFLNWCLIGGNLGFPALGIKGAAIATAIGTCVSSVIAIAVVLKPGNYLSIPKTGRLRFDSETVKSLIKVGGSSIAEMAFLRVGFLISGRLVVGVSTKAYVSTQIVQQISGLSFTLGDGVGSASTAMVGQSLGAGQKECAKAYVRVAQRISLLMSAVLILIMLLFRGEFPKLFTDDEEIRAAASLCFLVLMVAMVPQNLRAVFSGCLRGAGDVRYVAIVSLFSVAVIRPLLTWFFCYPMNAWFPAMEFGVLGNWISFTVESLIRATLLTKRAYKGKWVNIKI